MTDYKYAEPKDAKEATERIEHWLGDTTEFANKLGLHDPGNGREPYYPRFSGRSVDGIADIMVAMDQKYHPDKWVKPVAPVPTLRDSWTGTLVHAWVDVKTFVQTWTDKEHIKAVLRRQVKLRINQTRAKLLTWLGEPQTPTKTVGPTPQHLQKWLSAEPPPYDPETYAKVKADVAKERAEREAKDPKPAQPALQTRWQKLVARVRR